MTSSTSLCWCKKLGLSTVSLSTKKARQTALIEHVTANAKASHSEEDAKDEEKSVSQLSFSKEPTTFTWKFSKDELKQCDKATKEKETEVYSRDFTDKNGMKWRLGFYPKGTYDSKPRKTELFLVPMNWKAIGAVKVGVWETWKHLESGHTQQCYNEFDENVGMGKDFMDIPSVAPSKCPVCLEHVTETLTTECGHTFCAKCTVKLLTASQRIKCPLCRRTVDRNDELTTVRYAALESFTLTVILRTVELEKDKGTNATLGDVLQIVQSMESKLLKAVSGLKRSLSEMNQE